MEPSIVINLDFGEMKPTILLFLVLAMCSNKTQWSELPLESRISWRWFLHIGCDSWSIYIGNVHTSRNVPSDGDGKNSMIERSQLRWPMKDYCCVGSTQMCPPQPFQRILTSLGKSLAHKWIGQMPPCRLCHINAPEWNPVECFMVGPRGSPSGLDRYQWSMAWL